MRNRHRWLLRLRPATIAVFLKSVLGIKRFVVRTNAGAFFIDPVSNLGDALLTAGQYEPRLASVLSALLTAGDTFVDIGANEGYFSIIAAKLVGETGRVISIEPQSRLQAVIVRNLEENHVKNCTVSRKVISDNVGTTRLALSPDVNTGSSGIVPATRYRLPSESVASTTLTELFRDLEVRRVKLMKLDIEGSEYEAIFGSPEVFRGYVVENIALELHPKQLERRGRSGMSIITFLEECGYRRVAELDTLVLRKQCFELRAEVLPN